MSSLLTDVCYAIRRLRRRPGFALVAVLSIALGVGANSAVFTMINTLILSTPPIEEPERVLQIYPAMDGTVELNAISYPEMRDIQAGTAGVFSAVVSMGVGLVPENVEGGSQTLSVNIVSGDYFEVMGIPLEVGRSFDPEEYRAVGSEPVVILGYAYWQRRFGGDTAAVGQSLRLNGKSYTIIGVAPDNIAGGIPGMKGDLWAPQTMANHLRATSRDLHLCRGCRNLLLVKARLLPGVGFAEAQAALDRVTARTHEDFPDYDDRWGLIALTSRQVAVHPVVDRVLFSAAGVVMGIVVLVLLVACVNLAAFLLAQAADRRKEIAMRLALGAGRARLVRQLVTETTLIGLGGGIVGLALGVVVLNLLSSLQMAAPVTFELDFSPDLRVVGFTLLIALAAGVLFGLVPALQTTRPELAPTLKDESVAGRGPGRFSLRNLLVVAQVSVSFVLLVGSGLFLRSLGAASQADPGFGREPTAIASLGLLPDRYTEASGLQFYRRLLEETAALPSVESVALIDNLPLGGTSFRTDEINVAGIDPPRGRTSWRVDYVAISPEYFETAGVSILAGRVFTWQDQPGSPVAVINQTMAERFWPGDSAVGKIFSDGRGIDHRVIGVAGNTDVRALGEAPLPYIYYPITQEGRLQLQVLARTRSQSEAAAVARQILRLARARDADVIAIDVKTMEQHLAFMLFPFRVGGQLLSIFGALTILLASIGLYGVVSYSASARTREVGVRMSLGASRADVVRMVLRGGLGMVAAGSVLGLLLAGLASPVLASLLFGVPALDVATFAGVTLLMLVTGTAASLLPALRTSRVDPVRALKYE